MHENFGADDDLIREVAETFLAGLPEMLSAIESAIATSDAKNIDASAHTFKSTVAMFGAAPLVTIAQDVENCGRTQNLGSVALKYKQLSVLTVRLTKDIQELILKV